MGNNDKFQTVQVAVEQLRLDRQNPRISLRPAADDRACIERLADGKAEQLYALAKDIAENGLSIEPIVAERDSEFWTVKDGNRRVAVLKMLANPMISPDSIRSRIERLTEMYPPQPDEVEIHTSDNQKAIMTYVHRRHSGTGDGEGQLQWDSVEKAFFELSAGIRGQHDLTAKVLRYVQNEGIHFGHDFPITTMTRILTRERLQRLGILDISTDPPTLSESHDVVRARLSSMISDLASGHVHVRRGGEAGSVYESAQQEAYIQAILEKHPGQKAPISTPSGGDAVPDASRPPEDASTGQHQCVNSNQQPGSLVLSTSNGQGIGGILTGHPGSTHPIKPSWDRDRVIQSIKLHGVTVPALPANRKARNILVELKNINLSKSIIGPGMLVRSFLELSVDEYVNRYKLEKAAKDIATKENSKHVGLRHRMLACITHMHAAKHIDAAEKKALMQRAQQNHVSIDTLHSIVHSADFLPDIQTVNCFWDDLHGFLHHCWNS